MNFKNTAGRQGIFFPLSGGDNHKLELNDRKLEKKKWYVYFFLISIVPFSP